MMKIQVERAWNRVADLSADQMGSQGGVVNQGRAVVFPSAEPNARGRSRGPGRFEKQGRQPACRADFCPPDEGKSQEKAHK